MKVLINVESSRDPASASDIHSCVDYEITKVISQADITLSTGGHAGQYIIQGREAFFKQLECPGTQFYAPHSTSVLSLLHATAHFRYQLMRAPKGEWTGQFLDRKSDVVKLELFRLQFGAHYYPEPLNHENVFRGNIAVVEEDPEEVNPYGIRITNIYRSPRFLYLLFFEPSSLKIEVLFHALEDMHLY
jgi:hypothetical protein